MLKLASYFLGAFIILIFKGPLSDGRPTHITGTQHETNTYWNKNQIKEPANKTKFLSIVSNATTMMIDLKTRLNRTEERLLQLLANMEDQQRALQAVLPDFVEISTSKFYIEHDIKQNWTTAEYTCRKMRGNLASFKNDKEINAITRKLKRNTNYWLGINDQLKEDNFLTATGEKPLIVRWKLGEPNNKNSMEHCVLLNNGYMNDNLCAYETFFICKLK